MSYKDGIAMFARWLFASLAFCSPVLAQQLLVVPSMAHDGAGVAIVSLISPAGKEPVGLEWTIRFELPIAITPKDISAGDAGAAAEKQITCADGKASDSRVFVYKCLLVGGMKPIANGTVFVIRYRLAEPPLRPVVKFHLIDCLAVLQSRRGEVQGVNLASVDGSINAR